LSSFSLLNMKRPVILKQQRKKTDYWRKIIEESNLEVYRRIHDKPNEAENWTANKDINSLEHCHVYLFDVLCIRKLCIYCKSHPGRE